MTEAPAISSFEKANTAYEEGQKAFKENPTMEGSLKNYKDIKNRNTMDAVRGAKKNHGHTNPAKNYDAGVVNTEFKGGEAVMPGAYPKMPASVSDSEGFTQEQIDAKKKMEERQKAVSKPKSNIDVGKIAIGANTILGAMSGMTGAAAKLGDASRSLVQAGLNPGKGYSKIMDAGQQAAGAAETGIKGMADTQKQYKNNQKLLKERDTYNQYRDLEEIRSKYVDKMNNTDKYEDWGSIAQEYQKDIEDYFANKGIDVASMDPNGIIAKQIKRTGRELTGLAQRKKSRIGIEGAENVLDKKKDHYMAKQDLGQEKDILRRMNLEDKQSVYNMYTTGKDANNVDLSDDDMLTLDLLVNDVHDFGAAGGMNAGEGNITVKTYKDLAKAAENRMSKIKDHDSPEYKRLNNAWNRYQTQIENEQLAMDEREFEHNEAIYNDPDKSLVDKLRLMNRGKSRGYDLNDEKTFSQVGFVPNKNLIKDARYILEKNQKAYQNKIDELEKTPDFKNNKEYAKYKRALQGIEYERARMTPAFLLADVNANISEKLERTVPGKEFEMTPHYIRGKDGQDMTGEQWFEAVRMRTPTVELTDENLKAATYNKVYMMAMTANSRLQAAWEDYEKRAATDPDAKFEGLNTLVLDEKTGKPVIDDISGKPKTIGSEMVREISDTIRDYDTSLNLIHPQGSKTAPNMKEILSGIGQTLTDYIHNGGAGAARSQVPPSRVYDFNGLMDSDGNSMMAILNEDDVVQFTKALSGLKNPTDRTRATLAKMYHGLLKSGMISNLKQSDYEAIENYLSKRQVSTVKLERALKNMFKGLDNAYTSNDMSSRLSPAANTALLTIRSWVRV